MRNPSSSADDHKHFTTTSSKQIKSKTPCCSKVGLKKGPWTREEDEILSNYIKRKGEGQWRTLPEHAGLLRCGKSCRLRWMNYLRPSVKRGPIAPDEEDLILRLHRLLGNRWSLIAGRIPGRTDNEIKNYWNTHLSKKLISKGIDPRTHKPFDANPNSNSNQNPSCSKVLAHDWSTTLQVFPNNSNPNPNYSQIPQAKEHLDRCGNTGVNFSGEDLIMEKSDHDHHQENFKKEHHMNVNSSTHNEDSIFSSFLDSLLNDENNDYQFVNYQVQELQTNHLVQDVDLDHLKYSAVEPFSSREFNHGALWETEVEYAMETLGHAEENMAVDFVDHPLI